MGHVSVGIHTENLMGIVNKGVTLRTNDPVTPQMSLSIKAEIQGSVQILPGEAMQLRVRGGRAPAARLLVRKDPTETGELKVTDVTASAPWFSATATRLAVATPHADDGLPAGVPGDWVLEARVKGDAPLVQGRRRENIVFATGLPRQPKATVAVIVDLKPAVSFPVEKLLLKPAAEGNGAAADVFGSVRADLDPAALRIEARPEGLQAKVEHSASPRILTLSVSWKGGPLLGGAVTLIIGEEKVRIPVELWQAQVPVQGTEGPRSRRKHRESKPAGQ